MESTSAIVGEAQKPVEAPRSVAPVNPFAEFAELLNRDSRAGQGSAVSTPVAPSDGAAGSRPPAIPAEASPVASSGSAIADIPHSAVPPRSGFIRLLSRILDVQTDESGNDEVCINLTIGGKRRERRTG